MAEQSPKILATLEKATTTAYSFGRVLVARARARSYQFSAQ